MNECGLCERQLGDDAYLCPGCRKDATVRLEALPDLYRALASFLERGRGRQETRRVRNAPPGLPLDEGVLDLRGQILGDLERWRAELHADLRWDAPAAAGTAEERVQHAVEGLVANVLWIASSWPAAGEFAADVRDLAEGARSVVDPRAPDERGTRLGYCPAVYEDGVICGGTVRYRAGAKAAECPWCGCSYPPGSWRDLNTLMDADAAARNEIRDEKEAG